MKKLTTTQGYLDSCLKSAHELGYDALSDYEKEVLDAYDHGALNLIQNPAPKSDVERAIELNKPVDDMMKKHFGI